MPTPWDRATADLDPPLAAVDLAAFDANLADLHRRAGDAPVRLATKSVRCRALIARAGLSRLMAYALPEAFWHVEHGADDVLVGYPSVDRAALRALAADERARAAVTLMIDSVDHLDLIDAVTGPGHPPVRVCLELDVSWRPARGIHVGSRRSPVHDAAHARALAEATVRRPGFRLVGLMAYEGQIAGVGDATGARLKDAAVRSMQRRSSAELNARRAQVVAAVREVADLEFVNGGGSGSVERTLADRSVTEVAAGSALLGGTLFDAYTSFRPRPALAFALPVVRRPDHRTATLFAGGYVASGQAGTSRLPKPVDHGLHLTGIEAAGEVQTPVVGPAACALRVGDRVWLRHAKAGELAERFTHYHLVRGEEIETTVPTYRGEGQAFG